VVSDVHFEGHERTITKESPNRGVGLPLWANRITLLRIPTAVEADGGAVLPRVSEEKGQMVMLRGQVLETDRWDQFAPAIHRWEDTINRKAPDPTIPDGTDGRPRLSARFTEWMMGLDDGWITDCDVSRRDALRLCGNGVVPQQARLALEIMMKKRILEKEESGQLLPTPTTMDAKASNTKTVVFKFLEQGKQTCLTYEITKLRKDD